MCGKKEFIDDLRNQIMAAKETRIWLDFVRSLNLVSEKIFARSSHFVLELIQNAEDVQATNVTVHINNKRCKVVHDGRLFSDRDVEALCGIRTTKKPEEGTLGYLGIGFKSVFKITDNPQIYSGDFCFEFDKGKWLSPRESPWQVVPFPIDMMKAGETIDLSKTTFILPFRSDKTYNEVVAETMIIPDTLPLFLRWLKRVEVHNEVSGERHFVEKVEKIEKEDIWILRTDKKEQAFKVFRKEFEIPPDVSNDEVTIICERDRVKKREVVVAFLLDSEGNLLPFEAGATYGGVYSFLPLGEEKTGAKYLIQADFIVLPGRESINYEARWNHYLVEKICECCKEAIETFKSNERWKYQFPPLFHFDRLEPYGQPSWVRLFRPKLLEPLDKYRQTVLTIGGDWVEPSQAVKADEEVMRLIKEDELKHFFGRDKRYAHPNFQTKSLNVDEISLLDLAREYWGVEFLKKKATEKGAPSWFRDFYLALYKIAKRYRDDYVVRVYLYQPLILTNELKLLTRRQEVYLPLIEPRALTLLQKVGLTDVTFLHPDILEGASEAEKEELLKFFALLGLKKLEYGSLLRKFAEKDILPKISVSAPKPNKEDLLSLTRKAKEIIETEEVSVGEIYVLTKKGEIIPAKATFFGSSYRPAWDWEKNIEYSPVVDFVDDIYLENRDDDTITSWHKFFRKVGVRDEVSKTLVDKFAIKYAQGKLEPRFGKLEDVSSLDLGYDLRSVDAFVEVKGQRQGNDEPVELTTNETKAALQRRESYYLYVVSGIPGSPQGHLIRDPVNVGEMRGYLSISLDTWKGYKLD